MIQRHLHAFSALALLSAAAQAQNFSFQVAQAQSQVTIDSSFSLGLPGSVIGDYDALNNPGGTRTLPGLFGGSGNQPVPMDITFMTDLAHQGAPSGGFSAQIDVNAGTITVDGLTLDALAGQAVQADLTLELLYQTFRTFQPTSLFIGGIPLPLPLGQASVTGLVFVQNAPAIGVLVPDLLLPETFSATILVPTDVSFSIDLLGQVTPVGPLPVVLPLAGSLTLHAGLARLTVSAQQSNNQTIKDPFPGQTIDNLPLPVPTILPPGATANLLFNAVFGELALDISASFDLVVDGAAVCEITRLCSPTPNSVGSGAVIDVLGTASVSANNMSLRTTHLPPHRVSVVRFGSQQIQAPFGAGTLCVGGTAYRLPVVYSDNFGFADSLVDFSLPSPKYQALVPGSVWYFQCLYRDPLFSNPAGNASDAVRVQFCP
ncbi:MAG: hypothetical protein ABI054_01420 [Planctomycetota bacterium]